MKNKAFSFMYSLNIIGQAIFSLLTPAALMLFVSLILTSRAGAPQWIYAVLLPLGICAGLISMVRCVIAATAALSRLENEQNENKNSGRKNG